MDEVITNLYKIITELDVNGDLTSLEIVRQLTEECLELLEED